MAGYYFNNGARFLINDNEYIARREIDDLDLELENLNYKKIEVRRKSDLLGLWWKGSLNFRVDKEVENLIVVKNFNDIDNERKQEALNRYKILEPVINGEILPSEIAMYLATLGNRVKKTVQRQMLG